ncbi:MAG: AEC family transporter [Lachnospiraceae bacterium]|nr:AEC family transporter [Lachnospiraceae bacterium]
MELATITAGQVFVLFILIGAGFVGAKTGAIKQEGKKAFSDLLIYLVVPAMIIDSYMSKFDSKVFGNLMWAFLISAVLLLSGLGISFLLTAKQKGKDVAIMRFSCIFPNAAYMGFPLIRALFGAEGLLYASAFVTMFNILLWTVGYAIVSGEIKLKSVIKNVLATPVLVSVAIGLVLYLTQLPVPQLVRQPINLLGSMNTALSMVITGMIIAGSSMKRLLANKKILFVIAVRMLVVPVVCFAIYYVTSRFGILEAIGLSTMVMQVLLIQESCPTAAMTSVFAVQFGHDEDLAAGAVVITTFLSILTLPILALLMSGVV